jgi:ATP phosphoribosyltransferase
MLKLVLPKGSLERATLELFDHADLAVNRSSAVNYSATIDDPRIESVRILRPQEISGYVAEGLFDLGITGRDWIVETDSDVVSLGELRYSKATSRPVQIVVAVPEDSPAQSVADLADGVRVSSEYPVMTKRYFAEQGINADVRLSYGATEAKAPDIVDVVVDLTETGRALRAAGLRIIDTILTSYTELVANREAYEDPEKRKAMTQIHTLLQGVLDARGKVLVKLNIETEGLQRIIDVLPSLKAPTVNELFGGHGYAVETVVAKNKINIMIPELRERGATDIVELPISKIVH